MLTPNMSACTIEATKAESSVTFTRSAIERKASLRDEPDWTSCSARPNSSGSAPRLFLTSLRQRVVEAHAGLDTDREHVEHVRKLPDDFALS